MNLSPRGLPAVAVAAVLLLVPALAGCTGAPDEPASLGLALDAFDVTVPADSSPFNVYAATGEALYLRLWWDGSTEEVRDARGETRTVLPVTLQPVSRADASAPGAGGGDADGAQGFDGTTLHLDAATLEPVVFTSPGDRFFPIRRLSTGLLPFMPLLPLRLADHPLAVGEDVDVAFLGYDVTVQVPAADRLRATVPVTVPGPPEVGSITVDLTWVYRLDGSSALPDRVVFQVPFQDARTGLLTTRDVPVWTATSRLPDPPVVDRDAGPLDASIWSGVADFESGAWTEPWPPGGTDPGVPWPLPDAVRWAGEPVGDPDVDDDDAERVEAWLADHPEAFVREATFLTLFQQHLDAPVPLPVAPPEPAVDLAWAMNFTDPTAVPGDRVLSFVVEWLGAVPGVNDEAAVHDVHDVRTGSDAAAIPGTRSGTPIMTVNAAWRACGPFEDDAILIFAQLIPAGIGVAGSPEPGLALYLCAPFEITPQGEVTVGAALAIDAYTGFVVLETDEAEAVEDGGGGPGGPGAPGGPGGALTAPHLDADGAFAWSPKPVRPLLVDRLRSGLGPVGR